MLVQWKLVNQHFAHGGFELAEEDGEEEGYGEKGEGRGGEDDGLGDALAGVVDGCQG